MSHWKTGQKIQSGRYIINKVLGYGGSGITYLAKEYPNGNWVAIKTLNALIQNEANFAKHQERFIQEAFCLAKCNHQNVIQVHQVCQEGKLWCMIMEYIAGGTLRQYANYKSGLSEEEALHNIKQVGSALTYIHQQGFIHRDVKPGNIMLRKTNLEAILIDFGLAREFVQDKIQTQTNSRTESFAPLEQYEIRAKRGAYTDVYALAATLYYILTLQLPFPAPFRQQGAILISPKQHNPNISENVNNAILKGMELKPDKRPQSIDEWLTLLTTKTVPDSQQRKLQKSSHQVILNPARQEQLTMSTSHSSRLKPLPTPLYISQATSEIQSQKTVKPLISNSKIDYTVLHKLLTTANFKEADRETAKLMIKIADRQKQGWLDKINVDNFPCEELQNIDRLWCEASKQKFGFSIQKNIYEKLGGNAEYNSEIWRDFGEKVGWRFNSTWLPYKELNFNMWAPEGHLPMLGMQFWGFTGWLCTMVNRLNSCKIK